MMLFDTHIHLNSSQYKNDLDEVLKRAKVAGVTRMNVVGFDTATNELALELAEKYAHIYATVGWHPVDAKSLTDAKFAVLEKQVLHEKVVAVGECGFDYYHDDSFKDVQCEVFNMQIELAQHVKKPLMIHMRDATDDTYEVLKSSQVSAIGGIMHCFSDSYEWAQKFIELDFHISLGGPVTFKNAQNVHEVAKHVPIEKLLIETDAPYLTPHPHRGKRNEAAYVGLVAEKIAELKGLLYEDVCKITTKNAMQLFNIK